MKLILLQRWNGFKSGTLRDVPDGSANLLIRRKIAERVDAEPRKETATQRQYAVAGARGKAAK